MRKVDDAGWITMRKTDRNAAGKGATGRYKFMLGHVTTLVRNSRSDCGARLDSEQLLAPILSDKMTSGMTGLALRTGPLNRQTKGASFLTWTTPNSAAGRPITPCAACSSSATAGSASSALAPRRRVARHHECVGWAQSQFCDFLFSSDNSLFRETDLLFRCIGALRRSFRLNLEISPGQVVWP